MFSINKRIAITVCVFFAALFIGCNSSKVLKDERDGELKMNPDVVQGQLDNGMSYFVMKNTEPQDRILLRLVVKAGSCMEDDDQKGVAHFIEHLAFNGTENFEKNSIIDFFELIGMDFGADLNAYTSFEQTVYMLEIPADNPEILQKALLILHDWACAVSFSPDEIEKERGVVTEEWRGRRGLNGRVSDNLIDFVLDGSQFEKRLPIGDMDVIKNVSRERILDFYKKWYRPEFMAVVVAGDAETDVLEKAVVAAMENVPPSDKKESLPRFTVPPRNEKAIFTMRDPEQATTLVEVLLQEDGFVPRHTELQFKKRLAVNFASRIMDQRLSEITMKAESPWIAAETAGLSINNFDNFNGFAFLPKEGMYEQALKTILDEFDRVLVHGITQSELDRVAKSALSSAEQDWNARSTIESGERVNGIINNFILGKTYISDDDLYELYKKYTQLISVDYVNECIKEIYGNRGNLYFNLTSENSTIPSDEEIMDIWKNYKNEANLEAYVDDVPEGELMNRPSKKACIISKTQIPELGATEYILENGAKIYTKVTDFEAKTIRMSAVSKGGNYLVNDKDFPSLMYAPNYAVLSGMGGLDYNQFLKVFADKNVSLGLNVHAQDERFNASSSTADAETMLQIIYLLMAEPQFTDEGWNMVMLNAQNAAERYGMTPESVYWEKVNSILYGNDIRTKQVSPDFVKMMDQKKAEDLFRQRFNNAADFSFSFAGDFNEEELVDLCCYYLGNIPGDVSKKEEGKYPPYYFPKGITTETVYKGLEEKSNVFIAFGGKLPAAKNVEEIWQDLEMMEQLRSLTEMKLREVLREDKGGTYGVGVSTNIDGYPERYFEFHINFGCEPSRTQELADEVIAQLKVLKTENVDQVYIDKLTETYRRNFESDLRNNNHWLNAINATKVLTYKPLSFVSDDVSVPSWTTAEELRRLANKYIDTENYVCVFLKPEK